MIWLYAEFADSHQLVRAIRAIRSDVDRMEAYLPYPVPEVEDALAQRPSRLSLAVFAAGLGAAAGAYALQWLLNAYLYPLDAGGRAPHFPLAFVPITFEMGVLFASLTAFAAVLVGARLLKLWDPSRDIDGIESATGTAFWLEVRVDEEVEASTVARALFEHGALGVREVTR